MSSILFVTTNQDKYNKVRINLEPYGIKITHQSWEMSEIQSSDGEQIVRDKAQQAYAKFKKPVLVNDDTWSIPALRGFPSTGMKLCNDFMLAKDWLRLMKGVADKRVFLISFYAYHDGRSIKVVTSKHERYFLEKPQGKHPTAPSLEVIAEKGSSISIAEQISRGRMIDTNSSDFWKQLAGLLSG